MDYETWDSGARKILFDAIEMPELVRRQLHAMRHSGQTLESTSYYLNMTREGVWSCVITLFNLMRGESKTLLPRGHFYRASIFTHHTFAILKRHITTRVQ